MKNDTNEPGSEAARALAAMRRKVSGECVVCGKAIEGVRHHGALARLYCFHKCQKRAYRERKKLAQAEFAPREDES